MARDERTYGFSKADAQELTQLIGGADTEFPEVRPRSARSTGGGSRLVRFELVENWTSGEADADITEMDGTAIAVPGLLRDPELIFTSLVSGNRGLAIAQNGNYYIIQADCDQ